MTCTIYSYFNLTVLTHGGGDYLDILSSPPKVNYTYYLGWIKMLVTLLID